MLSVFNIVRISIFSTVLAWTLIVFGVACHLESMLIANDLTRFIPLAIFVSVCTLLIVPSLLVFGFVRRPFLVQQVRMELIFTGLLGLLWFILGIYTAFEPDTEVECDFDGDGDFEESEDFSTETFHAQYHTIEAFAIFNAILLFSLFFLLLLLSLRQHYRGNTDVWRSPVTTYPWFGAAPGLPQKNGTSPPMGLPVPVTTKDGKGTILTGVFGGKSNKEGTTMTGTLGAGANGGGNGGMKAGGHYIIYIPPPPPGRS